MAYKPGEVRVLLDENSEILPEVSPQTRLALMTVLSEMHAADERGEGKFRERNNLLALSRSVLEAVGVDPITSADVHSLEMTARAIDLNWYHNPFTNEQGEQ